MCVSTLKSWQSRLLVLFWNMSKGRETDTHTLSSCPHSSALSHILYIANNAYSQFSTQSVWGPQLRWLIRVIKFLSIMLLGTWVRNTCWNKVTRLLIPQPSPMLPQNRLSHLLIARFLKRGIYQLVKVKVLFKASHSIWTWSSEISSYIFRYVSFRFAVMDQLSNSLPSSSLA